LVQRDKIGRFALEFARVFDQYDPIGGLRDLGQQRIRQGCLAGRCPTGDEDVLASSDRVLQSPGLLRSHDPLADVVVEREHGDRGLADREGRSGNDRRQETFEAFAGPRQFGRNPRGACMHLRAYVVRYQANDALAVRRRQSFARVNQPARKPVNP
jgi:hypothetical protein